MKVDIHNPSDVLAWIFVFAIVGILGGVGILLGIAMFTLKNGNVTIGIIGMVVGTPMFAWMLWSLKKFNAQYHRDRIAAVKENPKSVLCGWEKDGKE